MMTIMSFGMCSLIITTAIALSTTNYTIQNLDYLSTKSFYMAEGGIDIAYGQVIYEVEKAIKSCSESNEEYYSYFLGNNKQNFINSIENINSDSICICDNQLIVLLPYCSALCNQFYINFKTHSFCIIIYDLFRLIITIGNIHRRFSFQ